MPSPLRFGAIVSCILISRLPYPPLPSPLSYPTSTLFYFTSPLLFPKEVNEKLSYRRQNALSVIKKNIVYNNDSEHIQYLSVRQSRLAERTDALCSRPVPSSVIRLSVCPFVRPSVCYQLVNAIHANEPILLQIGINLLPGGKGMNG